MTVLTTPQVAFEQSYRSYLDELGSEERYPFTLDLEFDEFSALVQKLHAYSEGRELPEGMVPNSTFWLIEDSEIVGVSNLRHYLTESLKLSGGHIGFGVRPSAAGRGVAKELLRQTIVRAGCIGLRELMIICLSSNIGSSRVIGANGGVLESEYAVPEYDAPLWRYRVAVETPA